MNKSDLIFGLQAPPTNGVVDVVITTKNGRQYVMPGVNVDRNHESLQYNSYNPCLQLINEDFAVLSLPWDIVSKLTIEWQNKGKNVDLRVLWDSAA